MWIGWACVYFLLYCLSPMVNEWQANCLISADVKTERKNLGRRCRRRSRGEHSDSIDSDWARCFEWSTMHTKLPWSPLFQSFLLFNEFRVNLKTDLVEDSIGTCNNTTKWTVVNMPGIRAEASFTEFQIEINNSVFQPYFLQKFSSDVLECMIAVQGNSTPIA